MRYTKIAIYSIITFMAVMIASGAHAYVRHMATCNGQYQPVRWAADKSFEINNTSGDYNTTLRQQSLTHPMGRINTVDDQWFDFSYTFGSSVGLGNGESEIWMDWAIPDNALGSTYKWYNTSTCRYTEADIKINEIYTWEWGVPSNYYDPSDNYYYIRFVHMHELLHAIGLQHEWNKLSSLLPINSYGAVPFTSRDEIHEQLEPVPDDRLGLRNIYEESGSERDIAVTNVWWYSAGAENEYLRKICIPSKGSGWGNIFDTYCATNPVTQNICPGDTIYARFSVMNYGTGDEYPYYTFWLSTDPVWTASDIQASQTDQFRTGAGSSTSEYATFTVPSGVTNGASYYVIVRIPPMPNEEANRNNWIPMRGTLTIKSSCP
ncbi:MAG: hypothetical protein Kow0090_22030 [Myxococcota bacterium]